MAEVAKANIIGLYSIMDDQVQKNALLASKTPESYSNDIFEMIQRISTDVIVPIGGIILTYVVCYELIQMIISGNNMQQFDVQMIFKWVIKTVIAIYLLSHTFDIVNAIFSLAERVTTLAGFSAAETMYGSLDISALESTLSNMSFEGLALLMLESTIIMLVMQIMGVIIWLVIAGRMIQIYLTMSMAPIPFATMINREWGQIGQNYIKTIMSLAFQGFLIVACLSIYIAMMRGVGGYQGEVGGIAAMFANEMHIHTAMWAMVGNGVLLCFTLGKTSSISQSIFGAH